MRNLLLIFFLFPALLHAGGFQVNLQGQKQAGMGHSGIAGTSGASALFFNPGAFSLLDSIRIETSNHLVFAKTQYLEPAPGIYLTETEPATGTPFSFYASWKVLKDLNVGVGIYTPYGSSIRYSDDWKGQFITREMGLESVFFQPTLGYQVNEWLGIGIGYVYAVGNFHLRKGIPVEDQEGRFGEASLSGTSSGHGFNAGVLIKPSKKLNIGMSYRSSVLFSLDDGEAEFQVPDFLGDHFPSTGFSTDIRLPYVANLGAAYQLNEKLQVLADINYTGWSSYDSLRFDFEENTEKLSDISSPRMYSDNFIFRLGGEYVLHEKVTLRSGVYYDMTPVPDEFITPETPGSDKTGVTAGFSYRPVENLSIDGSFIYIEGKAITATNSETGFGGTWKSRAFIPGIGLEWAF